MELAPGLSPLAVQAARTGMRAGGVDTATDGCAQRLFELPILEQAESLDREGQLLQSWCEKGIAYGHFGPLERGAGAR